MINAMDGVKYIVNKYGLVLQVKGYLELFNPLKCTPLQFGIEINVPYPPWHT